MEKVLAEKRKAMVEKDTQQHRHVLNDELREELINKIAEQVNAEDFERFQEYLNDLKEAVKQLEESLADAGTYPQESARALGRINAVLEKINNETSFGSLAWQFCQLDKESIS